MRRAIRVHRQDVAATLALVVLAAATVLYILEHQPAFTFGRSFYTVKAPFVTAAAVTPGQGQSVTIAGVQVGLVGGVQLENGQAVVTLNLYKRYAPIYRNATVLLRQRTPLKDMYLALDPGTASAGRIPNGGSLTEAETAPDIDVDQILDSLDADTRNYLLLLLSGGSEAFGGRGAQGGTPSPQAVAQLRGILKRFAPLDQHTETFASLLAQRSDSLRRAIHNLNLVTTALGGVNGQLASLIRASNTDFGAIASQDSELESGLSALPGTLRQTDTTLGQVKSFAGASGTALGRLVPFARALAPALKATRPLVLDTTGAIQHQLRPFAVAVQPLARTLRPAAARLSQAAPALSRSVAVLNTLFNTLAYQSSPSHSYLFWGAWLAHNADSLTSLEDANGPIVQGQFMSSCPSLNLFEKVLVTSVPSLTPLLDLLNAPSVSTLKSSYCPAATP
jgi:phospholipid/cholesterol/gamma-HCH transport system substrate-binding protein